VIDLLLRVAENLQRNRLVELECRPGVEGAEQHAFEFEFDGHHRAGLASVHVLADVWITRDLVDFRVRKSTDVMRGGFFGLMVEPEAGADDGGLDEGHGRSLIVS